MGIIKQGILGGFKNKTGAVVGVFWRNLNVIRALPRPSSKPPTILQIEHRSKFALVTGFLSYVSDFIDASYKGKAGSSSGMNEAVKYHMKEAVTGIAPNFTINYAKLMFSTGKLYNPLIYDAVPAATAKIDFSWSLDGADGKSKDATDNINVMVYNPSKNKFVTLRAAVTRSALTFSLQLPPPFIGDEVHCYFNFSSVLKDGLHSDSIYVKAVTVI